MKRFEVIQNIASPYRLHLFTEMWRQLSKLGVDFHVNFMSDMKRGHEERPISWHNPKIDFPHTYWKDYGWRSHHFNPGMIVSLRRIRPDVLLVGSTFDTFTGIAASWLCPAVVKCAWTEGNTKTTGEMDGVKGWLKRAVFSKYAYIGAPGKDGAAYVALHQERTKGKMPEVVMLPNLVDERRFRPRADWPESDIAEVRRSVGCSQDTRLCIIPARLEWYKGLLEFFGVVTPDLVQGWHFLIMGGGSLRVQLERLLDVRGLSRCVTIKEFVPYAEMPVYYAAADLFALPSLMDRNPLSVVEALHSGLPMALSSCVGNVEEAVTPGKNGWILSVEESDRLAQTVKQVFETPIQRLREMGKCSLEHNARFWDSRCAVEKFICKLLKDC